MTELENYINWCLNCCKKSAGNAKEIHMAHAFGAMDMYAITHHQEESKIHDRWNYEWYPKFTEEIWGYRP